MGLIYIECICRCVERNGNDGKTCSKAIYKFRVATEAITHDTIHASHTWTFIGSKKIDGKCISNSLFATHLSLLYFMLVYYLVK